MKRLSVILILFALSSGIDLNADSSHKIITDINGRTVNVPKDPKKIIAISSGALRLVCYIGAQDRVAGIERFEITQKTGRPYIFANQHLLKLPVIGPGGPKSVNTEPDLEAVLKIKPDLIIASYMKPEVADKLQKKLNIPVVTISYGERFATIDPLVFKSLDILGYIFNKKSRADEIRKKYNEYEKDLKKRSAGINDQSRPLVYAGGVGYKGAQGFTSTEAKYIPFDLINARNAASQHGKDEHLFVDEEKILLWNPDMIFIDAIGFNIIAADYKKKTSFYKSLKAFKNKKVYTLYPFNSYTTNIETTIFDAYAAGKIIFPDNFRDIDLKKKASEIFIFFNGKDVSGRMSADFGQAGGIPEFLK